MSEKTYINGLFIKKRPTQYGDVINVSVKVEALKEELEKHQKNGYVNMSFMNRKEPDKNGNNMYAILDTYERRTDSSSVVTDPNDFDDLPY